MFEKNFHKLFLLVIILIIPLPEIYNQDIHYSNNYENFFNLNPSSITNIKNAALVCNYRNQWPGSADFVNYSAAIFNTFQDLKSTVGLQIIRDDQGKGIITNTGLNLFYGYRLRIHNALILSAGLSGSYNIYSLNISGLTFENNQIPSTLENQKKKYFDFASGITFELFKKNQVGAAISHINTPTINSETELKNKITLSYSGNYNLMNPYSFRKIYIEPLIVTSFQSEYSEIIYGSRINIQGIEGGLFLRNDYKLNFDSFIILLGISVGNIVVNYTYDINLSGSQSIFNKLASHEVTFFYNLEYNKPRNKKRTIKCPKI